MRASRARRTWGSLTSVAPSWRAMYAASRARSASSGNRAVTLFRRPAWRTPYSIMAATAVRPHHGIAHHHFLVELDAHFENLAEILLVFIQKFVHVAVADQNDFHVD